MFTENREAFPYQLGHVSSNAHHQNRVSSTPFYRSYAIKISWKCLRAVLSLALNATEIQRFKMSLLSTPLPFPRYWSTLTMTSEINRRLSINVQKQTVNWLSIPPTHVRIPLSPGRWQDLPTNLPTSAVDEVSVLFVIYAQTTRGEVLRSATSSHDVQHVATWITCMASESWVVPCLRKYPDMKASFSLKGGYRVPSCQLLNYNSRIHRLNGTAGDNCYASLTVATWVALSSFRILWVFFAHTNKNVRSQAKLRAK